MMPQTNEFKLGTKSEMYEFINRCVSDIENQPDSMQAGLSSVLLYHISTTTELMQTVIA